MDEMLEVIMIIRRMQETMFVPTSLTDKYIQEKSIEYMEKYKNYNEAQLVRALMDKVIRAREEELRCLE